MNKSSRILITGAKGMIGKNLIKELKGQGYVNLILISHEKLNLTERKSVFSLFEEESPEYVFHVAAKVGGIKDNMEQPVEYLRDNVLINTNVIDAAFRYNVKKLINISSATIYPGRINLPKEEDLFKEELEKGNEAYALSKILGLKLCEYYNKEYNTDFITLAIPNLYGEYSRFDTNKSNVVAALIMKFNKAKKENLKQIDVWGSGEAIREFVYAGDLVKAMVVVMNRINKEETVSGLLNYGFNQEISIKSLAFAIRSIVGFKGEIKFDITKPEGIKKRALDSSRFQKLTQLKDNTSLEEGLEKTYNYFLETR